LVAAKNFNFNTCLDLDTLFPAVPIRLSERESMMRVLILLSSAVFVFLLVGAEAGNVKEVSSVAALDDEGLGPNVNVANYYAGSNGSDGGGGQFIQNGSGTDCTPDGGVVIQTTGTGKLCYFRQFAGPVHMNWYGVNSAPSHQDATTTQFGYAFDAARKYGNRTVSTDGVAINLSGGILEVPTGDALDCQGTIGGVSSDDWTVPTLPASIVIDPSFYVFIRSRATLKNCNIRPSWFTTDTQTDTTRHIIDDVLRNFSGTGVRCIDDGCSVQNVAVYGFDTGIQIDAAQRFYMNNVVVDSNVGVWWHAMAGASKNMNLLVDPVITQGNPNTEEDWSVTNVSADTNGECKLTLSTSPTDLHTDSDSGGSDTIWVYGIGATVAIDTTGDIDAAHDTTISNINPADLTDVINGTSVSGTGIPSFTVVSSVNRDIGQVTINNHATPGTDVPIHFSRTNTGPTGCNGRWFLRSKTTTPSYTVTLKGSSHTGPTTTATWHSGSPVMTVASLANIATGQGITSGSGIPSGTAVVNVLPATGTNAFQVIMSKNATLDQLTPLSRTFSNVTAFSGDAGQLILSAAPRVWTGNTATSGPNVFVAGGNTTTGSPVVMGLGDTTRIQPGMSVVGTGVPGLTTVQSVDSGTQVTLTNNVNPGGSNVTLTFSGCGYPGIGTISPQPWLGNCVATAYLMGGPAPGPQGDEDQGLGIVQAISKGWQVGFHLFNALDTRCTGCQANGAAQLHDKSEIGIWYDAATDETLWAGGGVHAYGTALLHAPTAQTNCDVYSGNDLETAVHDGFDFVHIEGCLQIIGSHTHNAADAYISAGADNTVLQGNDFPSGDLYYENSTAVTNTSAVGNTFSNGVTDHLVKLGLQALPTESLTIGQPGAASGMCLYNTVDQTTNYERACLRWSSNTLTIATEKGGASTAARDLNINSVSSKINLQGNGTTRFTVGSTINGSASGAQIASTNASATAATLVPNRAASSSTGIGADAAGDISLVVGANEDVRFDGSHHTTFKGTAPTASGSSTVAGNDLVGRITLGTAGTAVALTFNQAWTNTPICFAQDETTAVNPLYASTVGTTAVTFTANGAMSAGDKVSYRCLGYR
jgi:hypothetical protein